MKIHSLGVDVPDRQVDGRRAALADCLTHVQSFGFQLAEVSVPSLNVIFNGELIPQRAAAIRETLAPYDLRYSVHAPGRTNLAFGYDPDLEYRVLEASSALHPRHRRARPGLSQRLASFGCRPNRHGFLAKR